MGDLQHQFHIKKHVTDGRFEYDVDLHTNEERPRHFVVAKIKISSNMSSIEKEKSITASSYSSHEVYRMLRKFPQTDGSHLNKMSSTREKGKFARNFMYLCF